MFEKLFSTLAGGGLLGLPVATMLLFMAVFVGVVVWVYSAKRKDRYERISRLPLEDGPADDGRRER